MNSTKVEIEKLSKKLNKHDIVSHCHSDNPWQARALTPVIILMKQLETMKKNCKAIFGCNGKLFEPKTMAINEKIHKITKYIQTIQFPILDWCYIQCSVLFCVMSYSE
jgi:hypothetical protein